jgi:4-amino-4-deoxychorismate lyase
VQQDRVVAVLGVGVVDDPDGPHVTVDDLALTRGDGCFEATRVVVDDDGVARPDHLDAHLARMSRSAAALEIAFDESAWRSLLAEALAAWTLPGEAVLRWVLGRGREVSPGDPPTGAVTVFPMDPTTLRQRAGVTVATLPIGRPADAFADAPWLLGGVKTVSYAVNMAAGREARRRGVDDALWVSTDGFALEAPRSALIWRVGDRLSTTRHDGTGVLRSITQEAIFAAAAADGIDTTHDLIAIADLAHVDQAWLVSSGRLGAPILELDGRAMPNDAGWDRRLADWFAR